MELVLKLLGILFGVLDRTLVPSGLAFGFGFGCNSIIAEAAKWTEQGKTR